MPERARARERARESEREQRSGGADSSVAAPATVPALRRYTGGENAMADALGTHGCHEVFWVHTAGAFGSGGVLSPKVHPRVTGCAMWAVRSSCKIRVPESQSSNTLAVSGLWRPRLRGQRRNQGYASCLRNLMITHGPRKHITQSRVCAVRGAQRPCSGLLSVSWP